MDTIEEFSFALSEFMNAENERAALIFAFSLIEQFVNDLTKIKCKHHKAYENLSTYTKLNILNEINSVTDNELEAINWLRKQRNKAAHKPGYKANDSEIKKHWMMEAMKKKTNLQNFLATTVMGFWNGHPEIRKYYNFNKSS